ncbi:hypothetical protein HYQ46_009625 [Verticillium longisporum]|nr:hypothetical protein HYQ46_009625 [Verticillium longisporum]
MRPSAGIRMLLDTASYIKWFISGKRPEPMAAAAEEMVVGRSREQLKPEVGVLGGGVHVGDKSDEARLGVDEGLQRGPGGGGAGRLGSVGERRDAGGFKGRGVGSGVLVVRVDENQGDDFVGVGIHPGFNGPQPVLEKTGIHETAAGVAEAERVILEVNLRLEKTQARVEGDGGVEELVAGDGEACALIAKEGGIVRTHVSDIVVRPVT